MLQNDVNKGVPYLTRQALKLGFDLLEDFSLIVSNPFLTYSVLAPI